MTRAARPFGKLKAAASRALLEEMTFALLEVPDICNDHDCIMALLAQRFRAAEIFDYLDVARDMALQARIDEADLWERLQQA
jgi:hypothetical protein